MDENAVLNFYDIFDFSIFHFLNKGDDDSCNSLIFSSTSYKLNLSKADTYLRLIKRLASKVSELHRFHCGAFEKYVQLHIVLLYTLRS